MRSFVQNSPYERHFGLSRRLVAPAEAGLEPYLGAARQRVVEDIAIALSPPDAVAVILGAPGIGKSTLATAAARIALPDPNLVWLDTSPESPTELIEHLLIESGAAEVDVGRIAGSRLWKRTVAEYFDNGMPTIVLVENAHLIDSRVLLELNSLTAPDPRGFQGNRLIMMGSPGLNSVLEKSSLETLRQRVRCRRTVQPMDTEDTRNFLEELVKRAGAAPGDVFGPGCLSMIDSYSGGVPRVAQTLCESAMSAAAAQNDPCVSARIVHEVAATMNGIQRSEGNDTGSIPNSLKRTLQVGVTAAKLKREQTASQEPGAFTSTAVPTLTDVVAVETVDEILIADIGGVDELLIAEDGSIDEILVADSDDGPCSPRSESPAPRQDLATDAGASPFEHFSLPSFSTEPEETASPTDFSGHEPESEAIRPSEDKISKTEESAGASDAPPRADTKSQATAKEKEFLLYDEDAYEREIEAALQASGE